MTWLNTSFCLYLFINLEFKKSNLLQFLKNSSFLNGRSCQLTTHPKDTKIPAPQSVCYTHYSHQSVSRVTWTQIQSWCLQVKHVIHCHLFSQCSQHSSTSHHDPVLHDLQNRSLEGNLRGQYRDFKAAHHIQYANNPIQMCTARTFHPKIL